ncbi:MAG: isochorismatase family protein [Pseudomonadota bacterium]
MAAALIVVDMQAGLLEGPPKHELDAVIRRIDALAGWVRGSGGSIVWIRHCGGDGFEPHTPGWSFLPDLHREPADLVVEKTLNDAFAGTALHDTLQRLKPARLLIAGWATDFCVDATVRSAVSHDYTVVAVADGHTLADRPHLPAEAVIRHHNWVWSGLISRRPLRIATAAELLAEQRPG